MNTLHIIAGASLLLTAQANDLTIDQALKIAVDNAFSLKIADSGIKRANQSVKEAQSQLGFRLTGQTTYLRFGFEQTALIGNQSVVFQPLDQTSVAANLAYTVDLSGNARRQIAAAKKRSEATTISKQTTLNDLRQSVRRSYLQVLRAQGLVKVSEQALKNIDLRVDQTRKQYNAGAAAKIDLERFLGQQAATRADLIGAENNLVIAKQALNLAMARPVETEFVPADTLELPIAQWDPNSLVIAGQIVRPEVKSLGKTLESLGLVRRSNMQGLEPTLNFSLNHQRTLDPAGLNPQNEATTTSLILSVPFWDSGATRARVRQSEEDIKQAQLNLKQIQLGISQEVRAAVSNYRTAQARIESTKTQVSLAQEVARLARIRRDAGEGTVLEIIDSETSLTQAENALINARFDLLTAYADLQRAVGDDDIQAALSKVSRTTMDVTK